MKETYASSGVNKEAGYEEVRLIKKFIGKTYTEGVISELGGFSGLFRLDMEKFPDPVLVSGTDGVGTKLKLAIMSDVLDTVGEDLVAMSVNDILCQGATPLFFLDYIASGKLEPERMAKIVEGVANGCIKAKTALIGGETAEMPGFYSDKDFDMAGFAVGVTNRSDIIDGSSVREGDLIIGLPSSGVHSNGFSLIRKLVFEREGLSFDSKVEGLDKSIGETLLTPTKIYVNAVLSLLNKVKIHGMCHITGGGFYENIPRAIPDGLCADIDVESFPRPKIFEVLKKIGELEEREMFGTFNMGIGFIIIISPEDLKGLSELLDEAKEPYFVIGKIKSGEEKVVLG